MNTEYIRALEENKRYKRMSMFWSIVVATTGGLAGYFLGWSGVVANLVVWLIAYTLYSLFVGVPKEYGPYADSGDRFATFRSGGTPSGL